MWAEVWASSGHHLAVYQPSVGYRNRQSGKEALQSWTTLCLGGFCVITNKHQSVDEFSLMQPVGISEACWMNWAFWI